MQAKLENALDGNRNDPLDKNGFYVQWHFLDCCNLRCRHCYQESYNSPILPDKELLTIATDLELAMVRWNRIGRVSLTGGEPLFAPQKLHLLLDYFEHSPNFAWIGILTNGTLLDAALARDLKRYNKLKEVQVSLDGATAETHDFVRSPGSFVRALNGIEQLRINGFSVAVMFTLTRNNHHEALSIIDLADAVGCTSITVERVISSGQAAGQNFDLFPEEIRNIYESIAAKKKSLNGHSNIKIRTARPLWCLVDGEQGGVCIAGLTGLTIMQDGTALACRRLPLPLGNLIRDGLFKIWYTSPILWDLRRKNRMNQQCLACHFLNKCGGCRAAAYAATGDYLARDPQCWNENPNHEQNHIK